MRKKSKKRISSNNSLYTNKDFHSARVNTNPIPKPENWDDLSYPEQERYLIDYLFNIPLEEVLKMIFSKTRRKFVFLMADPQNMNKKFSELWLEAGYKNTGNLEIALTCPVTNTAIARLRDQKIYENLKRGSKILQQDDLLAILSTIVAQNKIPLQNGKSIFLKDQSGYFKALDSLLKYYNMNNPQYNLVENMKIEIKLPEPPNNTVKPIEKLNDESNIINVNSQEVVSE